MPNSKIQYLPCNYLKHAAICGDNKPCLLIAMEKWVQDWQKEEISNIEHFPLTSQAASAFLRICFAMLL